MNPYDTTIDANNVFPGLAENSEDKWQLAKSLRAKLASEGVDVDLDQCGCVVSGVLRQVRVVMNIDRPECLGDFATEVLEICSPTSYGPFDPEESVPLRSVVEAEIHALLAHILGADKTAETKARTELLGQH